MLNYGLHEPSKEKERTSFSTALGQVSHMGGIFMASSLQLTNAHNCGSELSGVESGECQLTAQPSPRSVTSH